MNDSCTFEWTIDQEEYDMIEEQAAKYGFPSVDAYLQHLANAEAAERNDVLPFPPAESP